MLVIVVLALLPLIVVISDRAGLQWPVVIERLAVVPLAWFPLTLPVGTAALLYLIVGATMRCLQRAGTTPSPALAALLGAGLGTLLLVPFWGIKVAAVFGGLFGGLSGVLVVPRVSPVQLIWEDEDD